MTLALGTCVIAGAGSCGAATTLPTDACLLATISNCPDGYLDGVATVVATKTASLKVSEPTVDLYIGTIVVFSGGDGDSWYENQYAGAAAGWMTSALARGQRIIQVNWSSNGWATGSVGPRVLACRGATLLEGIYNDPDLHTPGKPFIAVGQSAGASLICYSLAHYGLGDRIDLAVLTSGPPHSRIDWGTYGSGDPEWAILGPTLCTTGSVIEYSTGESDIIEVAYNARTYVDDKAICGGVDNPGPRDSIMRVDATLRWDYTQSVFVFGDADNTAACPLGRFFKTQVEKLCTEQITTGSVNHNGVPGSASGGAIINTALANATTLRQF